MQNTEQASRPLDQTINTSAQTHHLKRVSVVGGFMDGVCLDLDDRLNCIIGARGTGKTTILELVRYALDALPSRETNPAERPIRPSIGVSSHLCSKT